MYGVDCGLGVVGGVVEEVGVVDEGVLLEFSGWWEALYSLLARVLGRIMVSRLPSRIVPTNESICVSTLVNALVIYASCIVRQIPRETIYHLQLIYKHT